MNGLDVIGMIVAAGLLWWLLTRPSPDPRAGRPSPRAPRPVRGTDRPQAAAADERTDRARPTDALRCRAARTDAEVGS